MGVVADWAVLTARLAWEAAARATAAAAAAAAAEGMAWEVFGAAEATPEAMVVTAEGWARSLLAH